MAQSFVRISKRIKKQNTSELKNKNSIYNKYKKIKNTIKKYGNSLFEPAINPEYTKKAKKIMQEKSINVNSINNLKKRLGV